MLRDFLNCSITPIHPPLGIVYFLDLPPCCIDVSIDIKQHTKYYQSSNQNFSKRWSNLSIYFIREQHMGIYWTKEFFNGCPCKCFIISHILRDPSDVACYAKG